MAHNKWQDSLSHNKRNLNYWDNITTRLLEQMKCVESDVDLKKHMKMKIGSTTLKNLLELPKGE